MPPAETPLVIEGQRLNDDQLRRLWQEAGKLFARLNSDAAQIDSEFPWKSARAAEFDRRSLADWVASQTDVEELARTAVQAQLAADNGTPTAWQSLLGNLAVINGGGLEKFWTETETHRCGGGNQQLAKKLAESLAPDALRLGTPVSAISYGEDRPVVVLANGEKFEADDVILTIPPSVWNRISFHPTLPPTLRFQMGSNVKYLARVNGRFWNAAGLSQYSLATGPVSMTWEGTDGQPGTGEACLVAFSGGESSESCRFWPDAQRDENYLKELQQVFPSIREHFVEARFMDWPKDPWTRAGYSFPGPGQITAVGPMLREGLAGHLHFAGEHSCWAFVGFMEGALQSGLRAARRLAERDGVMPA